MCSPEQSSMDRLAAAVAAVGADDLALLTAEQLEVRLRDLRRSVLDSGLPQDNGIRPHLSVVLSWDSLVGRPGAAPAQMDGFGPVPTSLVRQLACDARVARVVIAPDGSPLELGRSARTASAAQRRGARVRDRGRCRVPGCRSRLVQLHHLTH